MWFDKTCEHFRRVAEKASKKVAIMSRLMLNLGGPREAVRQLYLNVTLSILLYGAPVWAEEIRVLYRRKEMVQIQRKSEMTLFAKLGNHSRTHIDNNVISWKI